MPIRLVDAFVDDTKPAALLDSASVEADHRIANHLAIIAAFIHAQVANLPTESMMRTDQTRSLLEALSLKIDQIGRFHRLLTHSRGGAIVDLAAYLREIAEAAESSLTDAGRTRILFDLMPNCIVSAKQGAGIGLLVGEALTNAVKHSRPAGVEASKIGVVLRSNSDHGLTIEVNDNGIGLPGSFDPHTSNSTGLRLMRALSDQLGGRLMFEQSGRGLSVQLVLPAV